MRKHKPTSMHSSMMRTARLLPVSAPGGGGVCLWSGGGVCLYSGGGVSLWSGGASQHALEQTPSYVNGMTDRRKNITFANFVCER